MLCQRYFSYIKMKQISLSFALLPFAIIVLGMSSCQHAVPGMVKLSRDARQQIREADARAAAIQVLPEPRYEKGSYEYFITHNTYPKTMEIYRNKALMAKAGRRSPIYISLSQQRGRLYVDGQVAADWPVSTGVSGHETPIGSYTIQEKKKVYSSSSYGKIKNAEGKIINYNADAAKDTVPEGGQWIGSPMPNWMRLTWDGVGMHTGKVRAGSRLSHGCIRTPGSMASQLYDITAVGTPVRIVQGVESAFQANKAMEESRLYQESLKVKKDAEEAARQLRKNLIAQAKKRQGTPAKQASR